MLYYYYSHILEYFMVVFGVMVFELPVDDSGLGGFFW